MKSLRLLILWITLLSVGLNLISCKQTDVTQSAPTTLVSSTQIGSLTRAQLTQRIAAAGIVDPQIGTFINLLLKYDIQAHRIVYKTRNSDNTEINASGVVIVPVGATGTETFPIVSQQHGTLFNEGDAPSYFTASSEAGTIGALFTSNGFILSCPDYIGYGESKNVPHPYLHRQTEALASLDMLRATREFLKTNAAKWDNRVFLAGYSQGGHATMSLLKMMEEQFPNEFTITAASCGAGPYNVEGFMQDLVTKTTHGIAGYNNLYVWVLQTYNRVYGLNRPMSYYFRDPYAADVQANGTRSTINVSINTAFSDGFKNGITTGSDVAFLTGVRDNNVYDWKPNTPLQLYHGTADQQVFYRNTTDAYNAMLARGATNVTKIDIPGQDHGPAIQTFLTGTFQFFNSKR